MGVQDSVKSLKQCGKAIEEIKKQLQPFVVQLQDDDPAKKAQAQAVMALSIGTLRYMGARLQGKDEGRKPDDPLRQELNQMRKVLVDLEKKRKRNAGEHDQEMQKQAKNPNTKDKKQEQDKKPGREKKRPVGKSIDEAAAGRMIKASLERQENKEEHLEANELTARRKRRKR